MKIRYLLFSVFSATLLLIGCGGSKPEQQSDAGSTQEAPEEAVEKQQDETSDITSEDKKGCDYTYVHDSTSVHWTAYKFESKAGVGGAFKECKVFLLKDEGSVAELMNGLEFRIPVASTATKNDDRDKKIKEQFFGNMKSTDLIVGEIENVDGDDKSGKLTISITMNGETESTMGEYTVSEDGHVDLKAELDVTTWNGSAAIAALNKVCEDLHREAPGQESKLWPNVSVHVKAYLGKNCD